MNGFIKYFALLTLIVGYVYCVNWSKNSNYLDVCLKEEQIKDVTEFLQLLSEDDIRAHCLQKCILEKHDVLKPDRSFDIQKANDIVKEAVSNEKTRNDLLYVLNTCYETQIKDHKFENDCLMTRALFHCQMEESVKLKEQEKEENQY